MGSCSSVNDSIVRIGRESGLLACDKVHFLVGVTSRRLV